MRIVIIGAGLCGGNVAVGLREAGYTDEILLLGDEPGVPFGRPPLSKTYLRDEEDLSGWLVAPGEWYEQHDVGLRPETHVERIDPPGGRVVLVDGGEITCDRLCIATGCRPRVPPVPGIDLDGVHILRTRRNADAIKAAAARGGRAAVIGMSFIGAEVAASLRQLGLDVVAIFPGSGPLESVLGEDVAHVMSDIHRRHGVELVPNDKVTSFRGAGQVDGIVTASGRVVECDFAVVGVGVEPNVEVVEGSGVGVDNGILVDARCRTSVENVFAAGDVANHDHPLLGRVRVEHYNSAEKQGRYAARSMLGASEPYDYLHSFWSDQYDDKIEYVGHAKTWDGFVTRGDVDGGSFLGFYVSDGRLAAAMGLTRGGDPELGPDSELATCARLIRDRTHVEESALADEAVELG
jgi:3-phenylpropionate/trans-cinnamate dioxygenase ferredoxin reductase subunit